MLTVGDNFPAFKLTAVKAGPEGLGGPDKSFVEISETSALNRWKIVFFWPKDFSLICPTEVSAFARLSGDFASRNAVVYGVSTDSEFAHLHWRLHHEELRSLDIPMLSDIRRELAGALGILDEREGVALRATFIVNPEDTIQWVSVYAPKVGRNPQEVLRVLDALQTDALCPCDWETGKPVIDPNATLRQAA